jgi:hypothetical protein
LIDPEEVGTDVRRLHTFFQRCYSRRADPGGTSLLDILAAAFVTVGPGARVTGSAEVRAPIIAAHERRPIEVGIENVSVRPDLDLGADEEWQPEEGATRRRRSATVMCTKPGPLDGLARLRLHEDWLADTRP